MENSRMGIQLINWEDWEAEYINKLEELTKFLECDPCHRAKYINKIFQNIQDLHHASLDGKIPRALYNEDNLNTINEMLNLAGLEKHDSKFMDEILGLSSHWYKIVREEEKKARTEMKEKWSKERYAEDKENRIQVNQEPNEKKRKHTLRSDTGRQVVGNEDSAQDGTKWKRKGRTQAEAKAFGPSRSTDGRM
eukprot:GFUD01095797.1.p1 GENE.GFUD01095797.1~~GFUD01095797.1.p1  ORF type:complete len:226 (+),score=54.38 GFUD01095797.1:100-678(+)